MAHNISKLAGVDDMGPNNQTMKKVVPLFLANRNLLTNFNIIVVQCLLFAFALLVDLNIHYLSYFSYKFDPTISP